MPNRNPDGARANRRRPPGRAPRALERLAATCLGADALDSRLGDLSEQYVRTHERVMVCLGDTPCAMAMANLAADIRYLCAAANVTLFARTVDRGVRPAERSADETIALELRERAMATMHAAAGKLVLPALLLVGSAFLISGAVNAWTTWRETEALIVKLQREKAQAAAAQIEQYVVTVQGQVAWANTERSGAVPPEQRRADYLRLLRHAPAIAEISRLNAEGKEVLRVSRSARDTIDSGIDFSSDARFVEARNRNAFVGPLYFNERADPYVSLAVANPGLDAGVAVAEVDIKRVWDLIDAIKIGETGYAYIVDAKGRLIASRDKTLMSRQPDLSGLPQVVAASSTALSGAPGDRTTFGTSVTGAPVFSVHANVPAPEWKVFVELPVAEARAPLWSALIRAAFLLALGLLGIFLASLAAARRDLPVHPARA